VSEIEDSAVLKNCMSESKQKRREKCESKQKRIEKYKEQEKIVRDTQ